MPPERISIWILGDQMMEDHPGLALASDELDRDAVRIVMLESRARTQKLPYHKKKQVLLFSAMRHYGAHLKQQGYQVDYRRVETFLLGLKAHVEQWQPDQLITMAAKDHNGRLFQGQLGEILDLPVIILPNSQFLVEQFDPYPDTKEDQDRVMEYFYRKMRTHFGVLMTESGEPLGGEWNYDKFNRQTLPKDIDIPDILGFPPDEITRQVMAEVENGVHGVGSVDGFNLAVTHEQAKLVFEDFLQNRLENFGPYEDAMTQRSAAIFHSMLSPYINLGLLDPLYLVQRVEEQYQQGLVPINSAEGFIRQVIGWREYIYWQYWRRLPEVMSGNSWDAHRSLPGFFWTGETAMHCLSHTFSQIRDTGYTHHIERLMLICNFSLLTGLDPFAVNDWFLSSFIDAYEWVMYPNVIGMGLNADSGRTATKPYISSANYIHKMSDYCSECHFDHQQRTGKRACPFNYLYWNFILQNEERLRSNPRSGRYVLGLRYLDEEERNRVMRQASLFIAELS